MSAIVVDGVRQSFGDTVALDGVSVTIGSGEVFALIGPNGAGKTTFVRCLTGTIQPDDGSVRVFDTLPRRVSAERVGYLPQDFSPPDRLSARELIAYYAGLYDDAQPVQAVLEMVGISEVADTWFEQLSGGERRRTLVGSVLVNTPDVLFLDEPTTGIDPAGRRTVWGILESLVSRGTTIVLTTHYMEEAARLADRVGVLADGSLVAVGSPSELVAAHGGPNELVIETNTPVELTGFDVMTTPEAMIVQGIDPEDIGTVVEHLSDRDVAYGGLVWRTPDLESVYLSLTGQTPGASESRVEDSV